MAGGTVRVKRRRWALVAVAVVILAGAILAAGAAAAGGLEAPTVEQVEPSGANDVPPNAPVSITFDRPMLAPLADRALHIQPAVDGTISWKGNTLIFTPRSGWTRGTRYSVSLDQSARSLFLLPLREPVSYQFMTAKELSVTTVQPADGATDVASDGVIVAQFSYPIVPLGTTGGDPDPLRIEPDLKGTGRWLTTSLYLFRPDSGLPAGVHYQVTIPKGIADTGGSALAADYSWSFSTKAPSVSKVVPEANTIYVGPSSQVRVTFDQPVDHSSAEQHFSLKGPDGSTVAGNLSWDSDSMVFQPKSPLQLATSYRATVSAGVKAVRGGGETKEFSWVFTTVGLPRVLSTVPAAGAANFRPYDSVQITFSNPMDQDSVEKGLTLTPKPAQWHLGWQDSDTKLFIWGGGLKPSTQYSLSLSADAKDRYGQKLSGPLRFSFTTANLPPRLNAAIPGPVGTFNAAGSPTLYLQNVNISRIDLALYKLGQSDFLRLSSDGAFRQKFSPEESSLVRRWSVKPTTERNQSGLTSTSLAPGPDGKLPSGFYFLKVGSPEGVTDSHVLLVSRLALTMKKAQGQILVWATDLNSGDVVPDLPLRIVSGDGSTLATGRTDQDGVLVADGLPPENPKRGPQFSYAFAEGAGDVGAVGSNWSEGINPYDFNLPWDPYAQQYRGSLYTDRPIYRPGQKVLFKGIVRSDDDAHYSVPPAGTELSMEVRDSRGRVVTSQQVKLNDMGTFNGELPLSQDASLGNYNISARIGDWGFGAGFSVAEYRKPEFEVKVTTGKSSYLQGDQLSVSGSAAYYFGQPLANSPLKWRVTSQDYLFDLPEGGYQFVDSDLLREIHMEGDRVRTEGKGTTDAQGNFAFQFPADLSNDPISQLFTIEATITDANNQEVSARTQVVVHKGQWYVGLRPERYVVRTGEAASAQLLVVDTNRKPVPGAQVAVSFYNRKWLSVKEKQPDGGYIWSSKPEDTLVATQQVTTDASGKARASTEAKDAGSIRVVAEVADPRGNRQRSATYLYVSGSGYASWQMESNDRLQLLPDRKEYSVGDTARVLVPSPMQDSLALITIERGKLLSHRVMRLHGNSEILQIPILLDYLPNVYVSAVLFKGSGTGSAASFEVGYGELKVAVTDKVLNISLTPDKTNYQPGEKATYTIKTTDSQGQGVPAEVSLAVVDASVLALADDNSQNLVNSFWGRRGLGVSSSSTLTVSVDRYNEKLPTENKGAGGGGDGASVRREFPDTAFWAPTVRTDDKGEATVTVPMPDTLTTWRATAKGVTASTQVGSATVDTVTSKSLLLRPALPRFLLMGDHVNLATLLQNYTGREVDVQVSLAAKGVQPEAGESFAPQRVQLPSGGVQRLEWPAVVESVPGGGSKAVLTLTAKPLTEGVPGDSVEITLPVNPLTTAEVVATSGEVRDSTTELVKLPDGINPAQGELTVETSPSLAAGMRYSARYLDEFPYECTEQTVSRFLPRVVMQRAFDKLGLPDKTGIAAQLPAIVGRSLQRLYDGQSPDGGWGWWPGEGGDQWITAYVVQGLAEARRGGYTVDQNVLDRAAEFLRRSLDTPSDALHPENPNGRAYVLYALALAGKGDLGLTNALYDRRSILGNYGKAYLLLALRAQNAGEQDGKLKSLVSDLSGAAIASATGAHWEEAQVDYRTMNTNTRSTAVVLDALVKTAPDNPLIPSAVRWLMVARKDGHWATTQETAASLLALTDYLEASGELKADFAYRVSLNGKDLATETVNRDNVDQSQQLVVQLKDLLAGADNQLNIARANPGSGQSGEGRLYYTMRLRYFLPGQKVPAVADGLALMREYYRLGDEAAGPIDHVAPGETVKVKLTVVALQDLNYLLVEDPLPSGLEAVDTTLKTTSLAAQAETGLVSKEDLAKQKEGAKSGPAWWQYNYFNHVESRDDRVALFATYLPKGSYEYTYLAQATSSGQFQALPTEGYEMYFPEVQGRSEGSEFTVK